MSLCHRMLAGRSGDTVDMALRPCDYDNQSELEWECWPDGSVFVERLLGRSGASRPGAPPPDHGRVGADEA
jgi:hypothetical protein